MPALSFKKRFIEFVEAWLKTHTLRNKRKRPIKPGDNLILCTGMRTKFYKEIMRVICTFVHPASVTEDNVFINHKIVKDKDAFAKSDGFRDFDDMKSFFKDTHELPWCGELISWGKTDPQEIFCK